MSQVMLTTSKIVALADSVRTHNSISDKLTLPEMKELIGVNTSLAPGIYNGLRHLVKSWDDMVSDGEITVENGVLKQFNYVYDYDTDPDYIRLAMGNDPTAEDVRESILVISNGVTDLADWLFSENTFLAEVYLPDTIQRLTGSHVFAGGRTTRIRNIKLPQNLLEITGSYVFAGLGRITDFILPVSVTELPGEGVFSACRNLKSISMSNYMTNIGAGTFATTAFTEFSMPNGITTVERNMFVMCDSLESLTIPDGVTDIKYEACGSCTSLKTVNLPDGLKRIYLRAFLNCSSLEEIYIPSTVEHIGYNVNSSTGEMVNTGGSVFSGCTNLRTIHYSGTATGAPWGAPNATVVP